MKKVMSSGLIIFLITAMFITTPFSKVTSSTGTSSIEWDVTLNCNEPSSGKTDFVVFGEASDANDGPPPDGYDEPKPPAPMEPYVRAWCDNALPEPYQMLWRDYRQYPDEEKTWDVYVRWKNSNTTPVNIMVTWDTDEFAGCEYTSVVLMRYNISTARWDFAANMLAQESYRYAPRLFNNQWLIDHFQVIAMRDMTPPETTYTLDGELEGDVYISDVTVTLNATDNQSGVDYTMYKVDGGIYNQYEDPILVSEDGIHTVYFYSVDYAGNNEDPKNCNFTIQYPCYIEIEIAGDLGVNAVIRNTGTEDITNLEWSITLKKGLVLWNREKTGVIENLPAGGEVPIRSIPFGIGFPEITVTAGCAEKTSRGFLVFIFMIGVQ